MTVEELRVVALEWVNTGEPTTVEWRPVNTLRWRLDGHANGEPD
jgi:hypothetical protein